MCYILIEILNLGVFSGWANVEKLYTRGRFISAFRRECTKPISVKFVNENRPKAAVTAGDVYGLVTFKVRRSKDNSTNQKFWLATTKRLYGSTRDGNYIIALELKDNSGKVIAREVLAEYSVTTTRKANSDPVAAIASFFGFDTSSEETKQTTNTQWSGVVSRQAFAFRTKTTTLKRWFRFTTRIRKSSMEHSLASYRKRLPVLHRSLFLFPAGQCLEHNRQTARKLQSERSHFNVGQPSDVIHKE